MQSIVAVVNNSTGIHARPAAILMKEIQRFASEIYIIKDASTFHINSVITLLSMDAQKGDKLVITANGEDEKEAVECIKRAIENMND
jgi:Phosphotransferase System HPr (HPr) Family